MAQGGAAAAAILGDALHTFPPDLGQGANSGLADVDTLLSGIELEKECKKGKTEKGTPEAAVRALANPNPTTRTL